MTAYSQLSDAELVRKVQELMGYEVVTARRNATAGCFLRRNKKIVHFGQTDIEAWSHAPNPLTDANVCMALVDEIKLRYFKTKIILNDYDGDVYIIGEKRCGHDEVIPDDVFHAKILPRAVCEVYCMVKEGQK